MLRLLKKKLKSAASSLTSFSSLHRPPTRQASRRPSRRSSTSFGFRQRRYRDADARRRAECSERRRPCRQVCSPESVTRCVNGNQQLLG